MIGAAHAGCFSMFLAAVLFEERLPPVEIRTAAKVHMGDGPAITLIELDTEANVPGCDEAVFLEHAEKAKAGCRCRRPCQRCP